MNSPVLQYGKLYMFGEIKYSDNMCKAHILPPCFFFFFIGTHFPNIYSVVSK